MRASVVIADDHAIFRDMLRLTLGRGEDSIEVEWDAASAELTLELVRDKRPSVLLLDLSLPGSEERDLVRDALTASPATKIVIVSGRGDPERVERAAKSGAMGYVLKRGSMGAVREAIRQVLGGEVFADPSLDAQARAAFLEASASARSGPS